MFSKGDRVTLIPRVVYFGPIVGTVLRLDLGPGGALWAVVHWDAGVIARHPVTALGPA